MTPVDESVAAIEVFEGRVPWIYADTEGNPTVGVGKELPTVEDAQALAFSIHGFGADVRATPLEIAESWNRVKGAPYGQQFGPNYYQWGGQVFLDEETIDNLLRYVVIKLNAGMPSIYADYFSWPLPAQLAILDMGYNLGLVRLVREYPHMNEALRAMDFLLAAVNCERDAANPAFERRNAWTKAQFVAAARIISPKTAIA